jgi:Na+-transporting methylmalonyl-CoA/oxaloacetate decarboxylase gamma subunit
MLESMNVLFVGLIVVFLALLLITGLVLLIPLLTRQIRKERVPGHTKSGQQNGIPVPGASLPKVQPDLNHPSGTSATRSGLSPAITIPGDNRMVAVIMAALQAYLSAETGAAKSDAEEPSFRITAVRVLGGKTPVWNLTGRILQGMGRSQGL